jgi:hypothetical protein
MMKYMRPSPELALKALNARHARMLSPQAGVSFGFLFGKREKILHEKMPSPELYGDGTTSVNATEIFKYMYTGGRNNFARTQSRVFENTHIPHKLLEIPGVRTIFLFCMILNWY